MRLWAEERKTGSIEILMTLPVSTTEAVLGKFLAAWGFIGIALSLTFPMWITVNVLGDPDNGVILAGYLGSFLMASAFLAIGSCISALTKNQVIAFIVVSAVCVYLGRRWYGTAEEREDAAPLNRRTGRLIGREVPEAPEGEGSAAPWSPLD